MVDGKVTLRKYCNKPKWSKWSILQDNYFDAFKREFPICDVAQGLIGDPLILSKGNPPVSQSYCSKKMIKCVSYAKIIGCSNFIYILIQNT